ncbi:MAG: indolepyruvate ferredoxin oxidoreductase subunit alpha [Eubacteriaceae bacterium]|nr:indolepyruvate ferredoxin oxidoreductase subunit alpha [Eubacteriaceae bacterium]
MKQLLTGDEAIARSAIDAGVCFASAYPGTPSTEILQELAAQSDKIYAEWAPNEKVALESAIGAAIAGSRAMASMKHVGLNVAADPFFTNAYTGIGAGLVVITADEPGMHSSQNEQDNRHYAYHANVPMFEPSNSQECYDMMQTAFELSETFDVPVLIRMTTRVCHSKSIVELKEPKSKFNIPFKKNQEKYVTVPAIARQLRINLLQRNEKLKKYSIATAYNYAEMYDTAIGIVASGVCFDYAKEIFMENASYYKVGFSHPMPLDNIKEFASKVDKLYVLEENDPIMETMIKSYGIQAIGKELFPTEGEMLPERIRLAFYGEELSGPKHSLEDVPPRPPTLCAGCPHRGLFYALGGRDGLFLSGDIGCYTLGYAPPFNAIDTVTCMGASISSAHGAQKIFDMFDSKMRAVAIIGDSTFLHTGLNSLMSVAYNNSKVVTIILDNRITAMTGGQHNPGTGFNASMGDAPIADLTAIAKALGIKHIKTVNPNMLDEVEQALDWAVSLDEASVIITRWPCVLKKMTESDNTEFTGAYTEKYTVDEDACSSCAICLSAGCPAISVDNDTMLASINDSCVGCSICAQICPSEAIVLKEDN